MNTNPTKHPLKLGYKASAEQFGPRQLLNFAVEAEALGTEEEIISFARRFDPHPFHIDPERAKDSIFGGLIASVGTPPVSLCACWRMECSTKRSAWVHQECKK